VAAPVRWKTKGDLIAVEGISAEGGAVWRVGAAVVAAILAITLAARFALPIPGTPVPVTLQDLAVLLVGVLLGPGKGAAAAAAYVLLGAAGAPVFSNGHGGLAWLMGPTGGYLLAYPACAWLVGTVSRLPVPRGRWFVLASGVLAAQAVLFAGGALQMGLITGQGFTHTLALTVTPFVPGIVVKGTLVVLVARRQPVWRSGGSS